MVLFWVPWTAATILGDAAVVYDGARLIASWTYQPVAAELTKNELKTEGEGEDASFEPVVEYRYTVDGKEFIGTKVRYASIGGGGKSYLEADLPPEKPGETITAYYQPSNPSVAVLRRTPSNLQWILPLGLCPFNALTLVGLLGLIDSWRSRTIGRPWLGMKVKEDDLSGTHVTFYEISPLVAMLTAGGGAAFLLIFAVFFVPFDFLTIPMRVGIAWLLVVAAAIWAIVQVRSSTTTLLIDSFRSVLVYRFNAKTPEEMVNLDEVECICKRREYSAERNGEEVWKTVVEIVAKDARRLVLAKTTIENEANRMAEWLGEKLRVLVRVEAAEEANDFDDDEELDEEDDEYDDDIQGYREDEEK